MRVVYEIEYIPRPVARGPRGPMCDIQALPPYAWCAACGMEVYEEGKNLCASCAERNRRNKTWRN